MLISHQALMVLHILSTCVWLGGHALALLGYAPHAWRTRDPRLLVDALGRLQRIALPALIVAILTGGALAWNWLPGVALWFNTDLPVAMLILGKLGLLLAMLLLQAYQGLRVMPTLGPERIGRLCLCIALQTLLAIFAVALGSSFRFGNF